MRWKYKENVSASGAVLPVKQRVAEWRWWRDASGLGPQKPSGAREDGRQEKFLKRICDNWTVHSELQ
jgi:hypothetical protein